MTCLKNYYLLFWKKRRKHFIGFVNTQKIVHLIFIAGEDYQLTEREKVIVESKI